MQLSRPRPGPSKFEAKAKAIKVGLETPRGQGLALRTTSVEILHVLSSNEKTCMTSTGACRTADVRCMRCNITLYEVSRLSRDALISVRPLKALHTHSEQRWINRLYERSSCVQMLSRRFNLSYVCKVRLKTCPDQNCNI